MSDNPADDPIGTVREVQNHVFVKLATPADEPWHIVWCHGEQFMSGWQSDEDMVNSTKWHGYLPVRECGEEGRHFVAWETYQEMRDEVDKARTEAAKWKLMAEQPGDREADGQQRADEIPRERSERSEPRRFLMTDTINGVPRDQYGMWCQHGKHVLVADPEDTSDHPATVPADPWPCGSCTLSQLEAELREEAEQYEKDRWDEYHATVAEGVSFGRMQ